MRYFNTAGPCIPEMHYTLPPEPRLPDARRLISQNQYFIVHAPRQTGKTTTLGTFARHLTAEGRHVALMFSCERAEAAGDDYSAAELQLLSAIRSAARAMRLPAELMPPDQWPDASPGSRIFEALEGWAVACPLPLVLFFDEIDALRGNALRSVLRQLRDGFQRRPYAFPASVVLCGLRDIQEFTPGAIERAFAYTQGQPWLVNSLAREVTEEMGVEPPEPVTAEHIEVAKERLILARAAHLDSLASKLSEPRVRRVIEPLIAGVLPDVDGVYDDDVAYVQDLGLIAQGNPVRIANPIYREVIARVLGAGIERVITASPQRFLLPDGRLDLGALLAAFAEFWIENGDVLTSATVYHEAAPHLVFMAFLQRIVNGGGYVDREYGVGRGRLDLLVRKPYGDRLVQREAIELKVWHPGRPDPLNEGLRQLDGYLGRRATRRRVPRPDPVPCGTCVRTRCARPAGPPPTRRACRSCPGC